jgi:hypothetical protein
LVELVKQERPGLSRSFPHLLVARHMPKKMELLIQEAATRLIDSSEDIFRLPLVVALIHYQPTTDRFEIRYDHLDAGVRVHDRFRLDGRHEHHIVGQPAGTTEEFCVTRADVQDHNVRVPTK